MYDILLPTQEDWQEHIRKSEPAHDWKKICLILGQLAPGYRKDLAPLVCSRAETSGGEAHYLQAAKRFGAADFTEAIHYLINGNCVRQMATLSPPHYATRTYGFWQTRAGWGPTTAGGSPLAGRGDVLAAGRKVSLLSQRILSQEVLPPYLGLGGVVAAA